MFFCWDLTGRFPCPFDAHFRLIEAISGKPKLETGEDKVDETEALERLNLEN